VLAVVAVEPIVSDAVVQVPGTLVMRVPISTTWAGTGTVPAAALKMLKGIDAVFGCHVGSVA
jgi:hypothetical protein